MTRKRKLGWIGMVLAAVLIVLGVLGYIVLHSQRLHSYVLAKIQQQASEATGAQVRIHGELLMLGFDVSERTISRCTKRAPRDP